MSRSRIFACVLCPWLALAVTLLLIALTPPRVAAQGKQVSFINDVAPILAKNCFSCHDTKTKKGKLDMTTFESFRKGGRNDDPVAPGKPKESYLIELLTVTDASRMPPPDVANTLPKEQIAIITEWIQQGAKLDGGITATANLRNELRKRWQPPTLLASYQRPALITAVAFTPDNKQVITTGYHELLIWDVETGKLAKRLHTRAERAHDMRFLKDGTLAVAGGRPGQEGDVRIYNLGAKPQKTVDGVAILDGVNDKAVLVAELIQADDEFLTLDVNDEGTQMAAAGCDRLIRIWDISKGVKAAKLLDSVENHADWVLSVNFSPNGQYLVTASRDKSAKVWDLKAKESLVTFQGHGEIVWGAVMARDHKAAISAGSDKQIRYWDAEEKSKNLGKQTRNTGAHSLHIFKLVEYRDEKKQTLATCSADGTVKTWDAANGSALKTMSGAKDWVYSLAISPNGELVAAGGYAGTIHIWKMSDGSPVRDFIAAPGLATQVKASK